MPAPPPPVSTTTISLVGIEAELRARLRPPRHAVDGGAKAAGVAGLGAHPVRGVVLFQRLVERGEQPDAGLVGAEMPGIEAVAVHPDLIAGTLAMRASSAISAETSTTNSAGLDVVEMVEDRPHRPAGLRDAERHAVHHLAGSAARTGRGVGTGAPIMSGSATISMSRSNPSNSDGLAVRIVTARLGRQFADDRHRAVGVATTLVMDEERDRLGHAERCSDPAAEVDVSTR